MQVHPNGCQGKKADCVWDHSGMFLQRGLKGGVTQHVLLALSLICFTLTVSVDTLSWKRKRKVST